MPERIEHTHARSPAVGAACLAGWLLAAWVVTVALNFDNPILLFAAAFTFGFVDGRWWQALLPVPFAIVIVAVTGAVDLFGGGCALCSNEDGFGTGALLLIAAGALPVSMLVAAGALIRTVMVRGAGTR